MLSTLVNTLAVLIGSGVGMGLGRFIPRRLTDAVMAALGLCTVYIGITSALESENTLALILSMALGAGIGTALNLDGGLEKLGKWVETRTSHTGKTSVAQGFVTGSLLFCVGSMTIVGALNAGLRDDHSLIYTKSMLDLISSCVLATTLGIGVMLAAAFVLVFQGLLVLLSQFLEPVLTQAAVAELTGVGGLMIIALGLNMIGVTKLKVANFLPGLVLAPLFSWLLRYLPI